MSDKMREEFEAWRLRVFCGGEQRLNKCTNAPDVYYYTEVQAAWQAWQACRELLVVELPDDGIEDCRKEWPERGAKYEYDTFDTGYLFACMKHEKAIEAAGLKVKP